MPFRDFLSTLRSSVAAVHSALEEVNIAQLSDEILELNLVELDNEVNDWEKNTNEVIKIQDSGSMLHAIAVELSSSRACVKMMKLMESVNFAFVC